MPHHTLLCLLFLILISPSSQQSLIDKVCNLTPNPQFCTEVLISDPSSDKTTLKGLGHISLNSASRTATETNTFITNSLSKTTDPEEKRLLGVCRDKYGGSIENIRQGGGNIDGGRVSAYNVNVNLAMAYVSECDVGAKARQSLGELHERNGKMLRLAQICIAVGSLLSIGG